MRRARWTKFDRSSWAQGVLLRVMLAVRQERGERGKCSLAALNALWALQYDLATVLLNAFYIKLRRYNYFFLFPGGSLCEECTKFSTNPSDHSNSTENNHRCNFCNEVARTKNDLSKHIRKFHKNAFKVSWRRSGVFTFIFQSSLKLLEKFFTFIMRAYLLL